MSSTAFKFGQLLAAADMLHAGYCADVRGFSLPPSLLGNQVLGLAQTSPAKALGVLLQRWKPYEGWAKQMLNQSSRIEALVKSDPNRGWAIRKALRNRKEMSRLAAEIGAVLQSIVVDDMFRAELLLGYLAGLPPKPKASEDADEVNDTQNPE